MKIYMEWRMNRYTSQKILIEKDIAPECWDTFWLLVAGMKNIDLTIVNPQNIGSVSNTIMRLIA